MAGGDGWPSGRKSPFWRGLDEWEEPTPEMPPRREIPDWPITCPKCKRPHSAVLLFAQYDCKHGCYRR